MRRNIFLAALMLTVVLLNAQSRHNKTFREAVRKYTNEQITPKLVLQQDQFMMILSEEEKDQLQEIKSQIQLQREKNLSGRKESRRHHHGDMERAQMSKQKEQVRERIMNMHQAVMEIANRYPEQVKIYQDFVQENMEEWLEALENIQEEFGVQSNRPSRDGSGNPGRRIERWSDPAWLLLWDPGQPLFRAMMSQKPAGPPTGMNSGLRAEIQKYVNVNVIPAIAEERNAFDQYLDAAEKEKIASARSFIKEYRLAGRPADDEEREQKRSAMKEKMSSIRKIAEDHQEQIRVSLENIRRAAESWRREMLQIAEKYDLHEYPEPDHHFLARSFERFSHPIGFLLFDPENPPELKPEQPKNRPDFVFSVYPNPADDGANLRLEFPGSTMLEIAIYSKEGEMLQQVYKGKSQEKVLLLSIDTGNLEDGIYLIRVISGETNLAHKLVVRH